jgi:Transposase IS66 family
MAIEQRRRLKRSLSAPPEFGRPHHLGVAHQQGVVSAPLPARIIEKCLVSDQIVIDTVARKYCDHQPLYRQSRVLERDSGVELSPATLDGCVLKVGELLIPMASAMRQELLRGTYIQADETPVDGWTCRCTMAAGRSIKPICGSINCNSSSANLTSRR